MAGKPEKRGGVFNPFCGKPKVVGRVGNGERRGGGREVRDKDAGGLAAR